jgi:hypothetical protein
VNRKKVACSVLILPLQTVDGLTYAMNENFLFMTGVVVAHGPELSITFIEKMDLSTRVFKVTKNTVVEGQLRRGAFVHVAARNDEAECIRVIEEEPNQLKEDSK